MRKKLDTREKMAEWVNAVAVHLVGFPNPQWGPILTQISYSVQAFDEDF